MEQAQVRSLLTECREREERPKSLVGAEKEVYAVAQAQEYFVGTGLCVPLLSPAE
jgi:hypothetical protein